MVIGKRDIVGLVYFRPCALPHQVTGTQNDHEQTGWNYKNTRISKLC
jgi:hypothetical protein